MNRACSSILKLTSSSHLWFCKYSAKTEVCRSLENYTFVDEMGKDQGINIRHKVTEMLEFIQVWDCPSFVLKPIGKSAFLCRCIFISNLFPHLLTSLSFRRSTTAAWLRIAMSSWLITFYVCWWISTFIMTNSYLRDCLIHLFVWRSNIWGRILKKHSFSLL